MALVRNIALAACLIALPLSAGAYEPWRYVREPAMVWPPRFAPTAGSAPVEFGPAFNGEHTPDYPATSGPGYSSMFGPQYGAGYGMRFGAEFPAGFSVAYPGRFGYGYPGYGSTFGYRW